MYQNSLSTLTAIYHTDAVVLDAAVSHVTRLTATVCSRGNGVSIICQQSATIERTPSSMQLLVYQSSECHVLSANVP